MKEEIKQAIDKQLNNNTAQYITSFESKLFKADPQKPTDQQQVLFIKIWELEVPPKDWFKGLTVKLPKKCDV